VAYQAEYIWIDGTEPTPLLRSKTKIIADGKTYLLDAWWLILFPGLAILVAALSFYLTGDALRQAVETRSERQ
jgi:ABC-type dipeptide/oligopeptide/nickel transport system permease subunit